MTVLYPSPIFGPVHSRRLGVSLGINLMPKDGKVCTFDCIYCECGFNNERRPHSPRPKREEVSEALEKQLKKMAKEGVLPDVLTFAGNGEPTAHPQFKDIVEDVLVLRGLYAPRARVAVLSNATFAGREDVFKALMLVDDNIQKLDTVDATYVARVNRPILYYSPEDRIKELQRFKGHVMIQTMFMHGTADGYDVSNISDKYLKPWIAALKKIRPQRVMIYTIDRETPLPTLQKATHEELDAISRKLQAEGFEVEVAY